MSTLVSFNNCVTFFFRPTRLKNTGSSIFYISVYLQWLGIYSNILDASYIRIHKYATRMDVPRNWTNHGNFTGWLGTTYSPK